MTTAQDREARATSVKTIGSKIKKAWMKLQPDSNCTEEEMTSARELIVRLAKKYELNVDWKTGKVTDGQGKPASQPKTEAKPKAEAKPKEKAKPATGQWSTADLALHLTEVFGKVITPKNLRRHLRTMDEYNDGRMTHYGWSGKDDPMVKKIIETMKGKKAS